MDGGVGIGEADVSAPANVKLGQAVVLWGRNRAEANASRFQKVFDQIWADPMIVKIADDIVAKEHAGTSAVQTFSHVAREYSNRILTSRTFEGECGVCQAWTPRESSGPIS